MKPPTGIRKVSGFTWRGRGLSKSLISRVITGVTPFRVLITLLITYILSPLPLQEGFRAQDLGFRVYSGSNSTVP